MRAYKCLTKQTYSFNEYQIVPIRDQDRYDIMQWRNEQIYHLRQSKQLDKESQDHYFNTVISNLFDKENPDQILFSYLENGKCIGYGGLVHINWIDKNAELSFIIDTKLEQLYFEKHWTIFLGLLEILAFKELKLHKLYTYAFDIRPKLFQTLEKLDYNKEATLEQHVFLDKSYKNVLIHTKINNTNYLKET